MEALSVMMNCFFTSLSQRNSTLNRALLVFAQIAMASFGKQNLSKNGVPLIYFVNHSQPSHTRNYIHSILLQNQVSYVAKVSSLLFILYYRRHAEEDMSRQSRLRKTNKRQSFLK